MTKLFLIHDDARSALERGVNKLATIVKGTLGPKGRNVIIDRPFQVPMVSTDGVFIAEEVQLEDPFENMGAQLVKEVASHTNDVAGDGTTTATVLAQALVNEGLQRVRDNSNPVVLKRGMERTVNQVVEILKSSSKSVDGYAAIHQIASLAAKDERIGTIIAEAFERVGHDATIVVEESNQLETTFQVIEGMQFERGFVSLNMVTDPNKMEAVLNDPFLLITEDKIISEKDIIPVLSQIENSSILVIADDVSPSVLGALYRYQEDNQCSIVIVRAPEYGIHRKLVLEDIAILTGGQVISSSTGRRVESATRADLGRARQIRVDKDSTTIIDGKGDRSLVSGRRNQILHQLSNTFQEFERDKLQQRLSKLSGGIAVVLAGGTTKVERRERQLRIEDALNAAQSAMKEGMIAGGGIGLLSAQRTIENNGWIDSLTGDERAGAEAVIRILSVPLQTIAENSGVRGTDVVEKVKTMPEGYGYNALTDEYVNMYSNGILDPVQVTYSALQNAASIAGLIITTQCIVTDKPENDRQMDGPCVGGGAELLE